MCSRPRACQGYFCCNSLIYRMQFFIGVQNRGKTPCFGEHGLVYILA